jgi:hypothetical protein
MKHVIKHIMTLEQIRNLALKVREDQILICGKTRGECVTFSNALNEVLDLLGISAAIQFGTFNGSKHAWLDIWLPEGVMICDLTADQFGDYPPVILGPMRDFPQYTFEQT